MTTRMAGYAVLSLGLVLCAHLVASPVLGEEESKGVPVVSVTMKNNKAISEQTILSKMKTQAGEPFSQRVLDDDLKRLYATDYFLDVSIDAKPVERGIAVTVIVEEKPIIDSIVFQGNKIMNSQKLKGTMQSKANEILNHATLTQDMVEMRKLYEKKGYQKVEVNYSVAVNKSTNRAVVTVDVQEKIRIKVSKITITGNKAVKTGRIVKLLGTKPAWLFNAGAFQEETFAEDLEKIRAVYTDEGYLDVDVKPLIDYSEDGTSMFITLEITEGKKYLVGTVALRGTLVFPEKEIMKKVKLRSGKTFSLRALREDILALREFYQHHGYMNVQIEAQRNLSPETGNIDVVFVIDPKEIVYVGKIEIKGNMKTKDIVIRRELRIYPGEKFDGDKIRRSKERLYNLGFFEDLYFDTEPTAKENVQDLSVTVKESKTGEFAFGGGYSTIDEFVGFVSVTQKNFDILNFPSFMGAGQNLTVKAEVGTVRQNYLLSWTDPWILGYPYLFGFDIYRTSHSRQEKLGYGYDEIRTGSDLRLGKEFTEEIRGDAMYKLEEVKITNMDPDASADLSREQGSNLISSVSLGLGYDTRDNIYIPTHGTFVSGGIEYAGGFIGGDKNYVKASGSVSFYKSFFERIVLELKGRTGVVFPFGGSDEVPIYERWFSGGADTIRGYAERKVGPRDPGSNDPIGGEATTVGNAEVTFPLYEKIIKGAVFYDVGNTWRRTTQYFDGNFKSGVGVGVRVKTPLGPFKLDYGYPLISNYNDKKEGQFYFSISHGF